MRSALNLNILCLLFISLAIITRIAIYIHNPNFWIDEAMLAQSKGTLSNIKAMHAVQKIFYVILNEELITSDQVDTIVHIKKVNKNNLQLTLF